MEKTCSRCGAVHKGRYDTCDECRAYNNINKMIYKWAEEWQVDPEAVRAGFRKAIMGQTA